MSIKTIYFMGAYRNDTSLGIYSDALIKIIKKQEKKEIIDIRRRYKDLSFVQHVLQYISFIYNFTFKKFFSKKDLIIEIHNINMIPPLMIWKKCKRIHIVHDFFYYDKEFYVNKKRFFKYIMYNYYNTIHKFLYKIVFKRASKIVAISQATKNEIIDKFWKSFQNKIVIIHNGMDTKAFKPSDHKTDTEKYLLYVGSELGRKNLKNIIAGFALIKKKYPKLKLIKAPIENVVEYRDQTLKYIKDNKLKTWKDVILIKEYLSLEKLVELYQNAEIFLFPTLKEWFWFPIIEAQACWTPVITTNYEPMCELVPYKNMTVNPNKPEDIANKVIKIMENPELKNKMIEKWLKYVKNFSWESTGKKFINLIEDL